MNRRAIGDDDLVEGLRRGEAPTHDAMARDLLALRREIGQGLQLDLTDEPRIGAAGRRRRHARLALVAVLSTVLVSSGVGPGVPGGPGAPLRYLFQQTVHLGEGIASPEASTNTGGRELGRTVTRSPQVTAGSDRVPAARSSDASDQGSGDDESPKSIGPSGVVPDQTPTSPVGPESSPNDGPDDQAGSTNDSSDDPVTSTAADPEALTDPSVPVAVGGLTDPPDGGTTSPEVPAVSSPAAPSSPSLVGTGGPTLVGIGRPSLIGSPTPTLPPLAWPPPLIVPSLPRPVTPPPPVDDDEVGPTKPSASDAPGEHGPAKPPDADAEPMQPRPTTEPKGDDESEKPTEPSDGDEAAPSTPSPTAPSPTADPDGQRGKSPREPSEHGHHKGSSDQPGKPVPPSHDRARHQHSWTKDQHSWTTDRHPSQAWKRWTSSRSQRCAGRDECTKENVRGHRGW